MSPDSDSCGPPLDTPTSDLLRWMASASCKRLTHHSQWPTRATASEQWWSDLASLLTLCYLLCERSNTSYASRDHNVEQGHRSEPEGFDDDHDHDNSHVAKGRLFCFHKLCVRTQKGARSSRLNRCTCRAAAGRGEERTLLPPSLPFKGRESVLRNRARMASSHAT